MTAPVRSKTWSSRRHHQLARQEMDWLLHELEAAGVAPQDKALDTAPKHSPAMRRFLGF